MQCTIERTEWQRSPSGACELAQVWLRLSGEPGEVELTLQDAAGRLRESAPLPLYMAGPPYFLRASCDAEHAAAGEPLPRTLTPP